MLELFSAVASSTYIHTFILCGISTYIVCFIAFSFSSCLYFKFYLFTFNKQWWYCVLCGSLITIFTSVPFAFIRYDHCRYKYKFLPLFYPTNLHTEFWNKFRSIWVTERIDNTRIFTIGCNCLIVCGSLSFRVK